MYHLVLGTVKRRAADCAHSGPEDSPYARITALHVRVCPDALASPRVNEAVERTPLHCLRSDAMCHICANSMQNRRHLRGLQRTRNQLILLKERIDYYSNNICTYAERIFRSLFEQ